jgi:hypothetical protein
MTLHAPSCVHRRTRAHFRAALFAARSQQRMHSRMRWLRKSSAFLREHLGLSLRTAQQETLQSSGLFCVRSCAVIRCLAYPPPPLSAPVPALSSSSCLARALPCPAIRHAAPHSGLADPLPFVPVPPRQHSRSPRRRATAASARDRTAPVIAIS